MGEVPIPPPLTNQMTAEADAERYLMPCYAPLNAEDVMLSRCLNPTCTATFRYLYEGRIFTIEHVVPGKGGTEPQRHLDHYWLCGACCKSLKVVVENGVVTTLPIHREEFSQTKDMEPTTVV